MTHCPECGFALRLMYKDKEQKIYHCKNCLRDWVLETGDTELTYKFWG